jgi:hypothetical protein
LVGFGLDVSYSFGWLGGWLAGCLVGVLVDGLVVFFCGSVGWIGRSLSWLVGHVFESFAWSIVQLVGWLISWLLVSLFRWLVDFLVEGLDDWLVGWLVGGFVE